MNKTFRGIVASDAELVADTTKTTMNKIRKSFVVRYLPLAVGRVIVAIAGQIVVLFEGE
jgi:hypothetical protein